MLANYDEVLGLFVSGKMSGLVRNAVSVAHRLSENGKHVRVVDTRRNSAAEGLLVLEAIRLAGEGLSLDALADRMEAMAAKSRIFVSVDTLKFMLKGGRVSKSQGFILGLLKLKPVVSIDSEGKGSIWAKTFTRRQAVSRMLKRIRLDHSESGIHSYGLVYADDPAVLDEFRTKVESIIGSPPRFIEPISSVVGLNAGRGAFAVAYVMEGK
jgi:DegV family protein with EDD domain